MRWMRDMLMVGVGATALFVYQKYNKQVMEKMECMADKLYKKADKALEDMM